MHALWYVILHIYNIVLHIQYKITTVQNLFQAGFGRAQENEYHQPMWQRLAGQRIPGRIQVAAGLIQVAPGLMQEAADLIQVAAGMI